MENYPHKNSKNQDSVIRLVAHPRAEESLYRCAAEGEKQHPKSLRERERERETIRPFRPLFRCCKKKNGPAAPLFNFQAGQQMGID